MNRLKLLKDELKTIWESHAWEVKNLKRRGPNGGFNAYHINGWILSPHQTITKAANLAGLATMPYWSGSLPTPSTAIPGVCCHEAEEAYKRIYKGEDEQS